MQYWLVKSEPDIYSIDSLKKDHATLWTGVRNYQARNLLKQMSPGDPVLFYHSRCEPPGVVGAAKVTKAAVPDPTQFERKSDYFDAKATRETPRWFSPEIRFVERFAAVIPLSVLKSERALSQMSLLRPGSRLSVHRLTQKEYDHIGSLAHRERDRKLP